MADYRVGIIGCGRRVNPDGSIRRGISYQHGHAYKALDSTTVVALADIQREPAQEFAEHFGFDDATIYTDYRDMLAEAKLDIVSVCTWPHLHAEMVEAAAGAGVKIVHCEKPMAPTFGEAKRMAQVCQDAGVQLTFNHQRRFSATFRTAKALLDAGTIGDLVRLEGHCSNFMDWGTHWFDMFFFMNDNTPAEWVLAQLDKRTDRAVFGLQQDDQGISWVGYENGVQAILRTGEHSQTGAAIHLIGKTGDIAIVRSDGGEVQYRNDETTGWETAEMEAQPFGSQFIGAIGDVIEAFETGREPELSAKRALRTSEVIFATYESCRRRGRVDLPLDSEDSALLSMIDAGEIGVVR